MMRRRGAPASAPRHPTPALAELDEWVRSLPWVVERPPDERWPDVRVFDVDCPMLKRHRLWLLTGLARQTFVGAERSGIAALMPVRACRLADAAGWEHRASSSVAGHVLVTTRGNAMSERDNVEAFVLKALSYALS